MGEGWLADGEEVRVSVRPHARVLVGPLLLAPVLVALASYAWFALPHTGWERWVRWGAEAALALLGLRWCLRPVLRRAATRYVVTTERVLVARGLLIRREHELALDRVADAWVRRSPLDRVLRSGTLVVESAGERGSLVLERVPGITRVQRALHEGRRGLSAPAERSGA